jgi:hypothetical protein
VRRIEVCTNKGPDLLQRGDNHKNAKLGWGHLKIYSRTIVPILSSLGTNHPWGERIRMYSNETDGPSPRGYNSKRVKMH